MPELPKLKSNEMKKNWPYYKQIKTDKYLKKSIYRNLASEGFTACFMRVCGIETFPGDLVT